MIAIPKYSHIHFSNWKLRTFQQIENGNSKGDNKTIQWSQESTFQNSGQEYGLY